MGKVSCLVILAALFVGFIGGSVLKVDLVGAVINNGVTSGFGLKVMLLGYLSGLGPYTLKISCGTRS